MLKAITDGQPLVFYFPALLQSAQTIQTTPHIETIWPTSVASWAGLALVCMTTIGYGYTAWKASNRPILTKIEEAKAYFTKELARVEQEFTEKIVAQQRHIDHSLDDYHSTVTHEINGWGSRITDHHSEIQRHEDAIAGLAGRLIKSEADREQINRRLVEMTGNQRDMAVKLDENSKETRQVERNMMNALSETERRILAAITGKRI